MWPPHGMRSCASMIDTTGGAPGSPIDDLDRLVAQVQELGERRRIGDRGRQPDEACLRRERRQPRQAERQMMAALAGGEGMQLVDDHALQVREELRRIEIGQQQRQRFRRGHQQVGRPLALAQPAALRRVAGPALRAHRQLHLGHRLFEVAADVRRQRLQRRDVERVQLALPLLVGQVLAGLAPLREFDQGRKETRPASCRRRSARSAARSGPVAPDRSAQAGAAAAPSRDSRTSVQTGREASVP